MGTVTQVLNAGRLRDVAYEAVKESLRAVVRCSDVFPPLKSSGQAILEVVERYDVSPGSFTINLVDCSSWPTGSKGDTGGTRTAQWEAPFTRRNIRNS